MMRGMLSSTTPTIQLVRAPRVALAVLAGLVIAVALIGWDAFSGDGDASRPATGAQSASESELRELAASQPVYWAGPRAGQTYELTRTSDGRVFVRYLPQGVKVGDSRPQFLTVATYPRKSAFADLQRASKASGAVSRKLPNGGLAVYRPGSSSVYFGYPDVNYQVEVFAPSPTTARSLVFNGQVVPVR
jgi:hypothetical protein